MSTFPPQRLILHRIDHLAEVAHRGDQLRLLGSLGPGAGHGKHFELALYGLPPVSFCFQNVERHTDIPLITLPSAFKGNNVSTYTLT